MTRPEWESLCDGCGRCCLNKFEEDDTLAITYTDVACRLLDLNTCRCGDYAKRRSLVPDCLQLTFKSLPEMNCLPPTCAYRRLYEGKELAWWHPLVSGDPETVHTAGVSVRARAISETGLSDAEIEARLVSWPMSNRVKPRP